MTHPTGRTRSSPAPSSSLGPLSTTGALWVIGPAWYVLCEAIAAAAFPGYNYATFYISDLGVPTFGDFQGRDLHSQVPAVMDAGFIGVGLFFLLGALLLLPRLTNRRAATWFSIIAVIHTAGITFVGLVPGSPENVALGLITIHVLGATAAIVAGNAAAIVSTAALHGLGLPAWHRRSGPILGALGLAGSVLLTLHFWLPDGVWERGAVYPFMIWQFITGILLIRNNDRPGHLPAAGE
ncbi:DUF998 domain-containing protein [Microbacterium gorillae]|uniref:DUF998 domain-containing protein n=1 Tax=Microbacterium gorillae TaxID=1231063 RepID=UPI000694708B|nr:DUF998 domain-containing protein [Microbacterium gorillae]